MKKFAVFFLLILCGSLIGGLYGIIHDQLTYTIAPEYYTKFKFFQFGIVDYGSEATVAQSRLWVGVVGFMATWWMGMFIAIILGLVGIIHSDWKAMLIITLKAFILTLLITFTTGLVGLAYGYIALADQLRENFQHWFIPDNLVDFKNYIAVGSMHNFSYLGGLIGLIAGVVYSVAKKNGLKNRIFWWTKRSV